jgi:hypothetical protein
VLKTDQWKPHYHYLGAYSLVQSQLGKHLTKVASARVVMNTKSHAAYNEAFRKEPIRGAAHQFHARRRIQLT